MLYSLFFTPYSLFFTPLSLYNLLLYNLQLTIYHNSHSACSFFLLACSFFASACSFFRFVTLKRSKYILASHVLNKLSSIFPIHFIAYTPRSYVRKMQSILQLARTFLKNKLRLLNQPLYHSYVSKLPTNSREYFL